MQTKKNDFIEIEFTGKANEELFDTNIKEEAKKLNPDAKPEPLILCIGQNMVIKAFDEALEKKELNKKYSIKLSPEQAFGKRNPSFIKTTPLRIFTEKNINPQPGMTFALDNNIVKILSVSGGRIIVDFNNPLAGKEIQYDFTIKRKISDIKEKINSLQKFFFQNKFKFTINKEKKKIIFKDEKIKPLIEMFKPKFKEILGYDIEVGGEKPNESRGEKGMEGKVSEVKEEEKKESDIIETEITQKNENKTSNSK